MLAVIVTVSLCLGAALGMSLIVLPLPASLNEPSSTELFPVSSREFSDERTVQISVGYGAARTLSAASDGMVTAASCESGTMLTSGTAPFHLDGEPLLLLSTSTPLWRDLVPGSTGADVRALEDELARLGADIDPDGVFTWATLLAFREVLTKAGGAADTVDDVAMSRILWLPSEEVPVTSCPVTVGTRVTAGSVLAELPSLVLGARVSPLPTDLTPGDRIIQVDDRTFAVDETGALSSADLDLFASTPSFSAAQQISPDQSITAQLLLTEAITTYVIPPRAIIDSGDTLCVIDNGATTPIEVLASQLGQSFVRPLDEGTTLSEVRLDPPAESTCD